MQPNVNVLRGSIGLNQFVLRIVIFLSTMIAMFCLTTAADAAGWSDLTIRMLPDSSFASVETAEGGSKIRHCPHHDTNGNLDNDQLIYVLGTLNREQWLDASQKELAEKHLEKHYAQFTNSVLKTNSTALPVSINDAPLTELVKIPTIGPVLAVSIMEYREQKGSFKVPEDIKNVKGIGDRTFNAIAHYIRVK